MVVPEHFEKCSSMTFFVRQSGSMPAATFALQVVTLLAAVTELLAAGDAAAGDCWSLPAAPARRAAPGSMRFETCGRDGGKERRGGDENANLGNEG